MDTQLQYLIEEARRTMRTAAGQPLSPEDIEQVRREAEVKKLEDFVVATLGFRILLPLKATWSWTDKGAAARFKVNDRVFQLRRDGGGKQYSLFAMLESGERELIRLSASDPLFASRILVAMGDSSHV